MMSWHGWKEKSVKENFTEVDGMKYEVDSKCDARRNEWF